MKIGVVAASSRFSRETADRMEAFMAANYPREQAQLVFHEACFEVHGHFAGEDATRARAFVEFANDPRLGAVWFARGGYGACRIADMVMPKLTDEARRKRYIGYSDLGSLLAALYKAGFPHVAHGPLVSDINRTHGDLAVRRAIDWLTKGWSEGLEPNLDGRPTVAFNLTVLDALMGTAVEPDLTDHVVMLEDVSEPLYRIDRTLCHLTGQAGMRRVAGIRLGRISDIAYNEPDFGQTPEEIVRYWCARSGIPYLGAADIGHDADNKVVPFGRTT